MVSWLKSWFVVLVEYRCKGLTSSLQVGNGAKNVPVSSTIAIIGEKGDNLSDADALAAEAVPPAETESLKPSELAPEAQTEPASLSTTERVNENGPPPIAINAAAPLPASRIFVSPLARKIALEKGIPLGDIKGSGPNGRIIEADVDAYKPPAVAPVTPGAAEASPLPLPSEIRPAAKFTDSPVSNMRRTIAARLSESKQQLPHYYVSIEVEMDKVLRLRELFNAASAEQAHGDQDKTKAAKLSVGDFITKATSIALQQVPEVNSAWYGDMIRQHHVVDVSIAVSTPAGLITPIIRNVGDQGLAAISAKTKELASRARAGKLAPAEYQGGTFTISNMGMFGISHFTAIINPPQSAILAIGGTDKRILPDASAQKGFKTAPVMQATLSSDHRVVDGATAARWMKAFKDALENPLSLML